MPEGPECPEAQLSKFSIRRYTLNIINFQGYLLRIAHRGGEGNKCMGAHLPQDYCGRTFGGEHSS